MQRFRDRAEAGRELGERLAERYAGRPDVLVLALPRGGVVVGREVADRLDAPLDVLVVRKLGFPGQSELAMGAIASGGVRVLNEALLEQTGVSQALVEDVVARERIELERREALYRGDRRGARCRRQDGSRRRRRSRHGLDDARRGAGPALAARRPDSRRRAHGAAADVRGARGRGRRGRLSTAAGAVLRGRSLVRGLRRGLGR